MQIRQNGSGANPPLVYQPLRSPKFAPGSSSTLPAKLSTKSQSKLADRCALAQEDLKTTGKFLKLGPSRSLNKPARLTGKQAHSSRELNRISEKELDNDESTLPTFLHSTTRASSPPLAPLDMQPLASGVSPSSQASLEHKPHFNNQQSETKLRRKQTSTPPTTDDYRHHYKKSSRNQQTSENGATTSVNNNNNNNNIDTHDQACLTEVDNRSSSEDNSNASSDLMSCGYFSEDSNQSMTDLLGCPLELRVQVKQYSDEKILKKNLSQDNLLRADYISRPNDKCK